MLRRPALLVSLVVLAASAAWVAPGSAADGDDGSPPGAVVLPATAVATGFGLGSQRSDLRIGRTLGDSLRLGDAEYAVSRLRGTLTVAVAPGKPPSKRLRKAGALDLRVGEGRAARKVRVLFRPAADTGADSDTDAWEYVMATARSVVVAERTIELIDADADGRISTLGGDAYRLQGAGVVVPLTAPIIVGASRVTFTVVSDDGSEVRAIVEPLDGAKDQLEALAHVNDTRAAYGLPGVALDPELSAACTAHATYLRLGNWTGYTNPHGEDEGRPGYSEAGAAAARASAIMGAAHPEALHAFYTSYYHRAAFVSPYLERLGVSSGVAGISVVDAKTGVRERADDAHWNDPSLVPADGATDVPVDFCRSGEQPEPCARPAARGFPFTVQFAADEHGVTEFRGKLERLDGTAPRVVPTLAPRALPYSRLFGLIPERPLAAGATYRATYSWVQDGEEHKATATFRTAVD